MPHDDAAIAVYSGSGTVSTGRGRSTFSPSRLLPPRSGSESSPVSLRDMDILETSRLIQRRVGLLETLPSFVLLLFVSTGSAICVVIAFLGDDLLRTILWTTSVIAGALVLFRLADAIVLKPVRVSMFARMAMRVGMLLSGDRVRKSLVRSWSMPRPGAMSLADDGRLLLIDHSTDYLVHHIYPDQISALRIVVFERGRVLRGDAAGEVWRLSRDAVRVRLGHLPKADVPAQGFIFLDVEYRTECGTAKRRSLIPFRADRLAAESYLKAIGRSASYIVVKD